MTLELISRLRGQALSHPLVLLLLCCAISWPIVSRRSRRGHISLLLFPGALFAAAVYAAIAVWYVSVPQYSDHAEPSVAAVSWVVSQSGSPYHPPDAAERYAFPYGPMLYLANAGALVVLGPSLASSKIVGVLASLLSVMLVVVACHRSGSSVSKGLIGLAVGYLVFRTASFWVRPEPLLLVAAAAALAAIDARRQVQVVVAGVALGLATATKVTAPVYVVPAFAMLWYDRGWKPILVAVAIGMGVFALPFALTVIRVEDYLYWTGSAVRHGLRWRSVPSAFEWALVISALPGLGLWVAVRTGGVQGRRDLGRGAFIACVVGSAILAAKRGTGAHHFLPFIPTLAYLEASYVSEGVGSWFAVQRRLTVVLVLAAAIGAVLEQMEWIPVVARTADFAAVAEVQEMGRRYEGALAVGYSSAYRLSFLRPLPVFAGQPYQLDAVAIMDLKASGDSMPPSVLSSVATCRMNVWLIPKGGGPFDLASAYDAQVPVFGPEFIETFGRNYRLVEHGRYFDVWVCRHPRPGVAEGSGTASR